MRFGWGIIVPCLLAALLIGVVLPFYTADDDGLDPVTMPVAVVLDARPLDAGIPFVQVPTERAAGLLVARCEIERGPPRS
jgi:hypothetical protein